MSFIIIFCTLSLVLCLFLGISKGAKALCKSIPVGDGEVERERSLKKQTKEFLKNYDGYYKVRGLWSPKLNDYRGRLYCEDYDFGILVRADSIDEFLVAIEEAIQADAWANREKRLDRLPKAERMGKKTEGLLITIFSISFFVFFITLLTTLLLSPEEDGVFYTASLTLLILSFLAALGTVVVGKVISIKSRQAKKKRTTSTHAQGEAGDV